MRRLVAWNRRMVRGTRVTYICSGLIREGSGRSSSEAKGRSLRSHWLLAGSPSGLMFVGECSGAFPKLLYTKRKKAGW